MSQDVTQNLTGGELISAAQVRELLANQHVLHGMFGRVFERMGGEEFLLDWAQDNPGRFLSMLVKMTPTVQPTTGVQGDVHLHVHHSLAPTELDVVAEQ
jgi:hypothetical protein